MYDIVTILMKRDEITKSEAKARVKECKRRLNDEAVATGDYNLAEEIIAEELGLEPDYIVDLLF